MVKETVRLFDDWASSDRAERMAAHHLQVAADILGGIDIEPGARFIDLGSGTGWACRDAQARGGHAVGIDLATKMLRHHPADGGSPVQAAFDVLPFEAGTFDVGWSMEALYYAPDLAAALAEAARVLRPGAELHVLTDLYEENEVSRSWPEDMGITMHLLSEAQWVQALTDASFQDVQARRVQVDPAKEGVDPDDWRVQAGTLWLACRRS